ncbi:folate hydrolase, partial [bacterium]
AKVGALTDEQAMTVERALLGPGLPGRPWYRHTLYAPGLLTGYGVKTIPGVREAIESRRWKEAEEQAKVVAAALDAATKTLGG